MNSNKTVETDLTEIFYTDIYREIIARIDSINFVESIRIVCKTFNSIIIGQKWSITKYDDWGFDKNDEIRLYIKSIPDIDSILKRYDIDSVSIFLCSLVDVEELKKMIQQLRLTKLKENYFLREYVRMELIDFSLCSTVTDEYVHLGSYFKEVNLTNCKLITNQGVQKLHTGGAALQKLNLTNCTGLTYVQFGNVTFKDTEPTNYAPGDTIFYFDREVINLTGCTNLKNLKIECPKVILDNCPNLTDRHLDKVSGKHISIKGCHNISKHAFRFFTGTLEYDKLTENLIDITSDWTVNENLQLKLYIDSMKHFENILVEIEGFDFYSVSIYLKKLISINDLIQIVNIFKEKFNTNFDLLDFSACPEASAEYEPIASMFYEVKWPKK